MIASTRLLFPILFSASLVSGCQKSDDGPDGVGGSGGADGNGGSTTSSTADGGGGATPADCYEPTPTSGEDGYVATPAARTHTFEITLPDDPEGGLVQITISGRQIFSNVRVGGTPGDLGFMSINGDAPEQGGTFTGSFVGAAGITYSVDVDDTYATDEHDSPVTLGWELAPARDCFEPNDTPTDAKPIAMGADVTAFPFAGYTTNDWPSYEDHDDYYAVDVATAGTLTVTLGAGPDTLALAVFAAGAPDASLADTFTVDETPVSVTLDVQPGTYLVRVEPFVTPILNSFDGVPTQWDHPYTLRATFE